MTRAEEAQVKLESLRGWLDHTDLDAVLLTSQGSFAWVTAGGDNHVSLGQEAGAASVLVTQEDAYLLAANNELRRLVDEQTAGLGFTAVDWPWSEEEAEGRIVERLCDPARAASDLGRLGLPMAPPDLAELRFSLLAPAPWARTRPRRWKWPPWRRAPATASWTSPPASATSAGAGGCWPSSTWWASTTASPTTATPSLPAAGWIARCWSR
jgi:hypothetical protein